MPLDLRFRPSPDFMGLLGDVMNDRSSSTAQRRRFAQHRPEPPQGAEVPHARRGLAQAETWAASLLESCSKWRSRTISRSSSSSCSSAASKPRLELAPQCLGRGRQCLIAHLRGQVERRAIVEIAGPPARRRSDCSRSSDRLPPGDGGGGRRSRDPARSGAARGETASPGCADTRPAAGSP